MKIGIIHAQHAAIEPLMHVMQKEKIEAINFCNEQLLHAAGKSSEIPPAALRLFAGTVFSAAEAGVDGILVACSLYCPYTDLVQPFTEVPVTAIDNAAIVEAVTYGGKIGILATTPASAPSCQKKMETEAQRQNVTLSYAYGISEEALLALRSGRPQEHDALLKEEAFRLKQEGCTSIFLSQITMARTADMLQDLGIPVYSTPVSGVRDLLKRIQEQSNDSTER